jgi:hypothetical protein
MIRSNTNRSEDLNLFFQKYQGGKFMEEMEKGVPPLGVWHTLKKIPTTTKTCKHIHIERATLRPPPVPPILGGTTDTKICKLVFSA